MTYLIYIIIISINIYYSFFYKLKRIKKDNNFLLLKENTIRKEILSYLNIINIVSLSTNLIMFLLFIILKININKIDIIGYIINFISYILVIISTTTEKIKKPKNTINKTKEQKNLKLLITIIIISFVILQRVGDIPNYSIYIYLFIILFLITMLIIIIIFFKENKQIICIKPNIEKDYLKDIKFINKICINKIFNYIGLMFIYLLLIYINFPFAWLGYIIICIMLLYIILDKIKKFKYQADKLTKTIYILKKAPGVAYAFEFYKDILLAKKIMLAIILFIISILTYYLNISTVSVFTLTTIELFILYNYIYLIDKKNLIKYISSLNEEFIDKKTFSLQKEFKINCIDEIKIFNVKFYKIICIDINNNIYSSNLILYDPESNLNHIKIYLNPYNISEDYIIIIKELYE